MEFDSMYSEELIPRHLNYRAIKKQDCPGGPLFKQWLIYYYYYKHNIFNSYKKWPRLMDHLKTGQKMQPFCFNHLETDH